MLLAVRQTAVGTPGVDFPTLNPFTVKTRVKYGLSAAALNTEITPFTEVPATCCPFRSHARVLLRCIIVRFAVMCFMDLAHRRHPSGQYAALSNQRACTKHISMACLKHLGCKQEGQEFFSMRLPIAQHHNTVA